MWWTKQNLATEIKDKNGNDWIFRVWHDHVDNIYIQRIFFWNKNKTQSGVIELKNDQTLHVSRLKNIIIKIAKDDNYRNRFLRELKFPIEEIYSNYFPLDNKDH